TEKLRVEQKAQSETLELNKPTERILGGGEKHNYQIKLAAGQLLHIVVEQKQINVRPTLLDPNGKKVAEVNYAVGVIGTEHLYYVGEENGVYELSIRAEYETALAGRYRVEIIELRAATQSDEKRMTAEHQLRAAKEFYELKNDNASRQSAEMFEEATRLYRELGDARGEEIALTESALIYNGLGDARGALENLNRALELNRSLGNRSKEAYNFNIIAEVHYKIGEYHKAYEIAERALAIHRELGDRYGEAFTLAQISLAKGSLGEKREAIAGLKKAWELLRTTGSPGRFEAFASNSTASWYSDIGEYQNALDAYQHTLEVLKRSPSSQIERTVLGNLGHIYNLLGDYEKSIEYSEKTLALERAAGARPHEVLTLNNLGRAYENRGELSKAYDLYSAALKLSREIKNPRGESKSLLNIGALSLKTRSLKKRKSISNRC
ncbi:MAG TPA: tetratricopeptide repeat protein, partial [Pyrinomonadaceae bacterium]|nr:tetratricopeptide repeat protein [Pyrinomonadaceae bacterium]